MALTRDILLERRALLEQNLAQLEEVIEQATRDLHATSGALQQCSWDLEHLDANDADVLTDGEKEDN